MHRFKWFFGVLCACAVSTALAEGGISTFNSSGQPSFYAMGVPGFTTVSAVPIVIGGGMFNPAGYNSVKFRVSGNLNVAGTATITLRDVTNASNASVLTLTSASNATTTSALLTLPAADTQYEIRVVTALGVTVTLLQSGLVIQ